MFRKELSTPAWLSLTFLTGFIAFVCTLIVIQTSFEIAHFPMKEVVGLRLDDGVPEGSFDQWGKDLLARRKSERKLIMLILLSSAVLYGNIVSTAQGRLIEPPVSPRRLRL